MDSLVANCRLEPCLCSSVKEGCDLKDVGAVEYIEVSFGDERGFQANLGEAAYKNREYIPLFQLGGAESSCLKLTADQVSKLAVGVFCMSGITLDFWLRGEDRLLGEEESKEGASSENGQPEGALPWRYVLMLYHNEKSELSLELRGVQDIAVSNKQYNQEGDSRSLEKWKVQVKEILESESILYESINAFVDGLCNQLTGLRDSRFLQNIGSSQPGTGALNAAVASIEGASTVVNGDKEYWKSELQKAVTAYLETEIEEMHWFDLKHLCIRFRQLRQRKEEDVTKEEKKEISLEIVRLFFRDAPGGFKRFFEVLEDCAKNISGESYNLESSLELVKQGMEECLNMDFIP